MTLDVATAFVGTFAIVALLGPALIRYLRRASYQQHAYEDAPQTHQKKTGTPTMGGLLFLVAPLVAIAIVRDPVVLALSFLIAGSAAIGFADDYLAIRRGRNRGLRARTKFLLTALVGAVFLSLVASIVPAVQNVLFLGQLPYFVWYALSLAVILATTHAVNLTDGLDGLAAGCAAIVLLAYVGIAFLAGDFDMAMLAGCLVGACIGFLWYNAFPATIFMGDTGSLGLGGAIAGLAVMTKTEVLLILLGGIFVIEALSVAIQVISFQTTRKRVFLMAPIHHHFELKAWSETKIILRFWIVASICGAIGFTIYRQSRGV
jgi:phospho-N-acetylmuramoyl-pentapeptide-transferase